MHPIGCPQEKYFYGLPQGDKDTVLTPLYFYEFD